MKPYMKLVSIHSAQSQVSLGGRYVGKFPIQLLVMQDIYSGPSNSAILHSHDNLTAQP